MWNSPSLLLQNLKRGVLNTKTHQTSITKRPCSALQANLRFGNLGGIKWQYSNKMS